MVFFSTINRTWIAHLLTIVLAEHVLRWVPPGTHTFDKYVTPQELKSYCQNAQLSVVDEAGMTLNPLSGKWSLDEECKEMNYIVASIKS